MTRLATVALLLILLALNCAAAAPVHVTDDRGVHVELTRPPQRIVSLLPSLTETVCALHACERLVGVDRYSTWPAQVKRLPQLGGMLDPDIEAIVALRPDLVILGVSSRAASRLEAAGLKVFALEQKSYASVQHAIATLGAILGVPAPLRLWESIQDQLAAVSAALPARAKHVRVYFEVGTPGYAAGASSFIGQTLARLGVDDIVPASLGPFPKLNPEYVVRANPDVIMMPRRAALGVADRPGWRRLHAIAQRRICAFSPEQADIVLRPGPRIPEAAQLMADCLARNAP